MDCNLPGSSVYGISQARIVEWVAISFSRGILLTQGPSHTPSTGKQVHYHWATRKAHSGLHTPASISEDYKLL